MLRIVLVAAATISFSVPARAVTCADVLARIGAQLADLTPTSCVHSDDLTTRNAATTPLNDSLPGVPAFAFTPRTDRSVISPTQTTTIVRAVPGIQLDARVAGDATGEARFLLRIPDAWNGDLVVAGASGTRSEFNGDFAWSDYVVQNGYAYASQNKGILNLTLVGVFATPPASDPLACRLNPSSLVWVHFYDNDPAKPFTEWQSRIVQAAQLAREGVKGGTNHYPRYTFAVGTSNGGYQVRRALEEAPDLFDGGVDWEGTFVDSSNHNILAFLPPAVANFPAYVASGFDPNSAAAQAIRAAGYPPDIVKKITNPNGTVTTLSLWMNYSNSFWEVTQCQWQKRLDPTYDTYGAGVANYNYAARAAAFPEVTQNLDAFATTGKIKKPLITVAGTMDALLPIVHQARAYADRVAASRKGNNDQRSAQYRLYEVQNGNHIETNHDVFPQIELIQPHAQRAFDLMVDHVENGTPLPPDQCIARGGSIKANATPGRCAQLFVP
jgi:pimeloyl-ACP methyl ester carboxylesterase